MGFRALTVATVLLLQALPVRGQQAIRLQFNEGQVTLSAQNAPVRAILAEWARLGGATIVNGDRVGGPPVTFELIGMPERQALDIVLRSVAGYLLAPRRAGSSGASVFDRILILPTSVAPRNPAPPPNAALGAPRPVVPRPPVAARQPEVALEAPIDNGQNDDNAAADPGVTSPSQPMRPGQQRLPRPPFVARPPQPVGIEPPGLEEEDEDEPDAASPAGVAPTPTNPFGIPYGSSATPGVVAPAPQPQRPAPNRVQ